MNFAEAQKQLADEVHEATTGTGMCHDADCMTNFKLGFYSMRCATLTVQNFYLEQKNARLKEMVERFIEAEVRFETESGVNLNDGITDVVDEARTLLSKLKEESR